MSPLSNAARASPRSIQASVKQLGVPAVLVGGDADALGIARSLGAAGVPVILADVDDRRPGLHSRYVRPYVLGALSGPALIEGLLALRDGLDIAPVLYLTTDRQVRAVAEHRERIAAAYTIRLPGSRCLRMLLHKLGFQQEAERLGFAVPRAVSIASERDFAEFDNIRFPAVIKPGIKEYFFANKAARARKVGSREEAESFCRAILPEAPDLIVQEWIEGQESDIYFSLQYRGEGGVTVRSFTGRKLRCWPPLTGSTASCTAAPEVEAELELQTTSFFDQVGFAGMCSMEFKRDSRTGAFLMIEPTVGRTDWQEEVASLNGVNIPLAAYCYELGLPIPADRKPRHSVAWMYPPSQLRSILAARSLHGFRLTAQNVKSPCWSFRDPIPTAYFVLEWLRKFATLSRWREFVSEQDRMKLVSLAESSAGIEAKQISLDLPSVKPPALSSKAAEP